MPGFVTHYLFGVNVLRIMKKDAADAGLELVRSIDAHKTVFQLGLQGPDIFFYDLVTHMRRKNSGSLLHTCRTGDFLMHLLQAGQMPASRRERETAQAYMAGFLGHYILDTQMHPYVYYVTEYSRDDAEKNKTKDLSEHVALETDIDTCLLMRYARMLPSQFPHGSTVQFGSFERRVVVRMLYQACTAVYPEYGWSEHMLSRAIRSMQAETRLLYNPRNTKRRAAERLEQRLMGHLAISTLVPCDELLYSDDPLNLEHRTWQNPWDPSIISQASVPQLTKKAGSRYRQALRLLDRVFMEGGDKNAGARTDLKRFLGSQCYHSGLRSEM